MKHCAKAMSSGRCFATTIVLRPEQWHLKCKTELPCPPRESSWSLMLAEWRDPRHTFTLIENEQDLAAGGVAQCREGLVELSLLFTVARAA